MNLHILLALLEKLEVITKTDAEKLLKGLSGAVQPSRIEGARELIGSILKKI